MVRLTDDVLKCLLALLRLCFLHSSGLWVLVILSDVVWETMETQLWTLQLVPFFSSVPLTFPMGSSGECLRAAGLVQSVDPLDQSKASNRGDVIGLLCSCPITFQFILSRTVFSLIFPSVDIEKKIERHLIWCAWWGGEVVCGQTLAPAEAGSYEALRWWNVVIDFVRVLSFMM